MGRFMMAVHMSLRLAWHNDGWNGHICSNPESNTYCVGTHSYPGSEIAKARDLEWERKHSGEAMCKINGIAPCAFSANAFGKDYITAYSSPPEWFNDGAKGINIEIPPMTACTWCYESMYADEVMVTAEDGRTYNNDVRFEKTKEYFKKFENSKSLIFYYAPYSNPFSESEQKKFVLIGVSRLKSMGDFYFYEDVSDEIAKHYARGLVWQKPITSCYPDQGLRIPYEKYMDKPDVLEKLLLIPENTNPFKYGSREVLDDDALNLIGRFIEIVDVLLEIGDTTENWSLRKDWLNSLVAELWEDRGPYPGYATVLDVLGLKKDISTYLKASTKGKEEIRKNVYNFLLGRDTDLLGSNCNKAELNAVKRNFLLTNEENQHFLLELLPRFDLLAEQIETLISDSKSGFSVTASLKEILENPYLICEQYIGVDSNDSIPFYRIDNGVLPSPELGVPELLGKDSAERLRALCINEINKIAAHTFASAESVLEAINRKLAAMPFWKQHQYVKRNFIVDRDILIKALFIKEHDGKLYLYLKHVYEDECLIQHELRSLANRLDIKLRMPLSEATLMKDLSTNALLSESYPEEYEKAICGQATIIKQIFTKPISVISGAAGTGKTTIIRIIIDSIIHVHGTGTGFLLMAPTGKATERIKAQTSKGSTTIHSFLANRGWLNVNYTFKRFGGRTDTEASTIIIDECSMVDLSLFAALCRAINWNSVQRLILVGDPNQLPPIGRGKVFGDVIDWLQVEHPNNVGVLKNNLRQMENRAKNNGTAILELAQVFIQEKQREENYNKLEKESIFSRVQYGGDIDLDLNVVFWRTPDELKEYLADAMVARMEKTSGKKCETGKEYQLWDDACKSCKEKRQARYMQIISPYRGEFYGTENLNTQVQKFVNPGWVKRFTLDGITIGDKVIQYRNRSHSNMTYAYSEKNKRNEKAEVYNGEIGFVRPHGLDWKKIHYMNRLKRFQVDFFGINRDGLRYSYGTELGQYGKFNIADQNPGDNLELAYAISVHKSQGSDFDNVIVVIPNRNSHLLSMELIYTAITRAQKHLTLLVQDDISTLVSLSRLEKSATQKINSSVFSFVPLEQEMVYMGSWYEEGKIISTLSEYLVRSKSEMNIANILALRGIEFKYEYPLFAPDGTMYLPDFTVLWHGDEYYWEHVGLLDIPEYRTHWEKKEQWYEKHFPGKLIKTFEDHQQTQNIEKIILEYFT